MLEVVANALRSRSRKFIRDGFYENGGDEWGYDVTVWDAGHYHMISVSHFSETSRSGTDSSCARIPAEIFKGGWQVSQSSWPLGILGHRQERRSLVHAVGFRYAPAIPQAMVGPLARLLLTCSAAPPILTR